MTPPQLLVAIRPLVWNVKDYGAIGNGVADDTAAIQATIDAAIAAAVLMPGGGGGGTVYLPAGEYKITAQLKLGDATAVHFCGAGMHATKISCHTDLGAGQWAIGIKTAGAFARPITLEKFALEGPQETNANGLLPADMDGIRAYNGFVLRDIYVAGFRAGVSVDGNHQEFDNLICQNNYWGMYWNSPASSSGDQVMTNCNLAGSKFAGAAIGYDQVMAGCTWVGCHFGFGPYGIWAQGNIGSGLRAGAMQNVTFIDCAFEQFGNAILWDEDNSRIFADLLFIGCDSAANPFSTFDRIGTRSQDYAWRAGTSGLTIINNGGSQFLSWPGAVGIFSGQVSGEWFGAAGAVSACISEGKKILVGSTDGMLLHAGRSEYCISPYTAGETLVVGDLLEFSNNFLNKAVSGAPVGVAVMPASTFDRVVYCYEGPAVVRAVAGAAWNKYAKVGGAGNAGKIQEATGGSDGNVCGLIVGSEGGGNASMIVRGFRV